MLLGKRTRKDSKGLEVVSHMFPCPPRRVGWIRHQHLATRDSNTKWWSGCGHNDLKSQHCNIISNVMTVCLYIYNYTDNICMRNSSRTFVYDSMTCATPAMNPPSIKSLHSGLFKMDVAALPEKKLIYIYIHIYVQYIYI